MEIANDVELSMATDELNGGATRTVSDFLRECVDVALEYKSKSSIYDPPTPAKVKPAFVIKLVSHDDKVGYVGNLRIEDEVVDATVYSTEDIANTVVEQMTSDSTEFSYHVVPLIDEIL